MIQPPDKLSSLSPEVGKMLSLSLTDLKSHLDSEWGKFDGYLKEGKKDQFLRGLSPLKNHVITIANAFVVLRDGNGLSSDIERARLLLEAIKLIETEINKQAEERGCTGNPKFFDPHSEISRYIYVFTRELGAAEKLLPPPQAVLVPQAVSTFRGRLGRTMADLKSALENKDPD